MVDIEATLDYRFPNLNDSLKGRLIKKLITRYSHEAEINQFIQSHPHLEGRAFIQKAFDYFRFSYRISAHSLANIPAQGRVIIVANHPIGTLDGLALLKMVKGIRPDVKVVANELLYQVNPLKSSFIPINNMNPNGHHKSPFKQMVSELESDSALILFPAGEVSRFSWKGIIDSDWKTGFIKLAQKTQSPILPLHIGARNSTLFYLASSLKKSLGTMFLMNEMFNKNGQTIDLTVGKLIPSRNFENHASAKKNAQTVKNWVYQLGHIQQSQAPFQTIDTISHPLCRQAIREDLKHTEHLMTTPTGLELYLADYHPSSALMQELGRVRELTFRAVGEGTGTCWDLDQYDQHYRHLILWDDKKLEIVGGYRLGECRKLIEQHGRDALYANHMFQLKDGMDKYLPQALELGRCFVQPQYWGTRALDYLWYGMGHYLKHHPEIKYLFGSISLSNNYSQKARELIVSFYNTQFGCCEDIAHAKCPFVVSGDIQTLAKDKFRGDYPKAFKQLNRELAKIGEKLPMLFKQYVELCDDKGCQFIDFNVAMDFNNCIGSLMMLEIDKIKESKYRYLEGFK